MNIEQQKPANWGTDCLSQFIDDAVINTYSTFLNLKLEYNILNRIHIIYKIIADSLKINDVKNISEWFSSFFLIRSHSAYLAAVRLSLSAQVPESYMVLRGCLENALYGIYFSRNQELSKIWLQRHKSEEFKKRVRNEFTSGKLLKFLESIDKDNYIIASELYDKTIDCGAHPNPRSLFQTMDIGKENDSVSIDYFITNTIPMQLCLKSCAQIGICSIDIFRNVYNKIFDSLGITAKLLPLKNGL
jgi:hypothetical protein